MSVFVLRRFLILLAALVGASLIIFLVQDVFPGNAGQMLTGDDASLDMARVLTVWLALDQHLGIRILPWLEGMAIGTMIWVCCRPWWHGSVSAYQSVRDRRPRSTQFASKGW